MNMPTSRPPVALRSIALVEIAKGVLALAAACGLLSLRHTDLHAVADTFLWRHGIDPDVPYRHLFIEGMARAASLPVKQVVGFAGAYATIRFAEGFGLWWEKHWAEWFAVISSGLYLPIEVVHFVHHPSFIAAAVVVVNIGVMLYLAHLLIQQRAERRRRQTTSKSPDSRDPSRHN